MNLKTAASRLSVHYQTAYKLVRSGSLAAVKIGGTYEISDAALERYRAEREALRAGAATARDLRSGGGPLDTHAALEELRSVAASTTTSARGAFDTAARVGAEAIGDACVIVTRTVRGFQPIAYHDTDPRRRAALEAVASAFGESGPDGCLARVRETKRGVLVSHVPQDRLRAAIDPQHLQFLDIVGVHSLALAPVVIDGRVSAVVALDRATPGAPYSQDDLAFAREIAGALQLALTRVDAYRAGWQRRRELVDTVQQVLAAPAATRDIATFLHEDRFGEIVQVFTGERAANDVSMRFTNGVTDVLVLRDAAADSDGMPAIDAGDLAYLDEERDVTVDGRVRRFILHRGVVRDEAAQPQALVVVAQPAPYVEAPAP